MTMTTIIPISAVPFAAMAVCGYLRALPLRRKQQGEITYEVSIA